MSLQYRELQPGELTQRGDLWWDGREWMPILGRSNCDQPYQPGFTPLVRRSILHNPPKPEPALV